MRLIVFPCFRSTPTVMAMECRPVPLIVSTVMGSFLGLVVAFIVISTLVEISNSYVEALLFGVVLILLGCFIIWRTTLADELQPSTTYKAVICSFAALILVSGGFCFFLQGGWHRSLSPAEKTPIFFLLGTALSFSIIFGLGDIVNICYAKCIDDTIPIFHSTKQVFIVVGSAVLMGAVEGFVFGFTDAEDDKSLRRPYEDIKYVAVPLGCGIGAVVGFVNQLIRSSQLQESYHQVGETPHDDDDLDTNDL